jgi:hypothetical protein
MEFKRTKYILGWDTEPPKGDRCALSIGLTPEQHAATMRANVPPGDEEGAQILRDLDTIQKTFVRDNPGAVCSVFIFNPANADVDARIPASRDSKSITD